MTAVVSLALLSLVATLVYLGLFVTWHLMPTGYNPVRHAVSDYAVGRSSRLFRVGLWVSSLAVLALALALIVGVGSPPLAVRTLVFALLIPIARVGMTLFPTTLEGQRFTRTALVHYLLAIAAFTFTYLVISEATGIVAGLAQAQWLRDVLSWTAAAVGPELVVVVVTMIRPLRRVFGLFERLFLVTTNVWFAFVAVALVRCRCGGVG